MSPDETVECAMENVTHQTLISAFIIDFNKANFILVTKIT